MTKNIIFDTKATGVKEPVLIKAAWGELESLNPYSITNPFVLQSLFTTSRIMDFN